MVGLEKISRRSGVRKGAQWVAPDGKHTLLTQDTMNFLPDRWDIQPRVSGESPMSCLGARDEVNRALLQA